MKIYRNTLFLILPFLMACQNQKSINLEEEKEKILKLHHLQRDYHFNKDSIAFANQMSDDFISVNRGDVTFPKKGETIARYHGYFSSVEFLKWDDITEPIIRFSDDGTLAYTVVDKMVKVRYTSENEEEQEGETHFVWTAIYRKIGEDWTIECVTSTNE